MLPTVIPQLVANDGMRALRRAIGDPDRFACEPKVDGVRGLVVYQPERILEMRNRRGDRRDWLRGDAFEAGLRRLADRLPNLGRHRPRRGTDRRSVRRNDVGLARVEALPTVAPVRRVRRAGPARNRPPWPPLAGAARPTRTPRARLRRPVGAQPAGRSVRVAGRADTDGRLEGIVLKDRTSTYRDGTRVGWSKVKDRSWYEREAWRFDRR